MIALSDLIQGITSLRVMGENNHLSRHISTIQSDSRLIEPGDAFIALKGEQVDGHSHIKQALERGCSALIIEDETKLPNHTKCPVLVTEDTHQVLGPLASALYAHPVKELSLIGITGTNGKTTTSAILENILIQTGYHPGVIGTIDSHFHNTDGTRVSLPTLLTTPDPLTLHRLLRTMADSSVTHVIIEASSHALVQQRLGGLCFQLAVFTNLSHDHLDYHNSMDDYFEAKKLLFTRYLAKDGSALIVQADHHGQSAPTPDYGARLAQELRNTSADPDKIITCGFTPQSDLTITPGETRLDGSSMSISFGDQEYRTFSPLTGRYNMLNTLAACGCAICLGIDPHKVFNALPLGKQVDGRLEKIALPTGNIPPFSPQVIVDYAHTPDALENVLRTLKDITPGRLICLFGCGGDRDRTKRRDMGNISAQLADLSIITSDNPRSESPHSILLEIEKGLLDAKIQRVTEADLASPSFTDHRYLLIENRRRAIHTGCSLAGPQDVVLIAGKGHETYQDQGGRKRFFDDRIEAVNGLITWNTHHLIAATGGTITHGVQSGLLDEVVTDSRTISPGQIFLALKGDTFDGHHYLAEVVAKGAKVVITEHDFDPERADVMVLVVSDTLRALGDLAAYRGQLLRKQLTVIGITGSCGKTTVKEMTGAILAQHHRVPPGYPDPILKTAGNFNNLIGLPLTLLRLQAHHRIAVVEMGMNQPGEIARLTEIAVPDIGCITNVHAAHLEGLGDLKGVAAAKGELFTGLKEQACRVINCDDPNIEHHRNSNDTSRTIHFARSPEGCSPKPEISAESIHNLGPSGIRFTLCYGDQACGVSLAMGGMHTLDNALTAAAICFALQIPCNAIASGLATWRPADKRMQIVELPASIRALNDCYNANPGSMRAALTTVADFANHPTRKGAALGDMLELGNEGPELHREIGELVGELGYDYLALTGKFAGFLAQGAMAKGMKKETIVIFEDKDQMAAWFADLIDSKLLPAGSWLLIKGSRGMRMERMLSRLQELLTTETVGS